MNEQTREQKFLSRLKPKGKKHRSQRDKKAGTESQTKRAPTTEELQQEAAHIRQSNAEHATERLLRFAQELEKVGGRPHWARDPAEARGWLLELTAQPGISTIVRCPYPDLEMLQMDEALTERGIRIIDAGFTAWLERQPDDYRQRVQQVEGAEREALLAPYRAEWLAACASAQVGLSGANYAIAASGTLVLLSGQNSGRLASLLPPVHVALIIAERILYTVEEAVALIRADYAYPPNTPFPASSVTFITGPSRTADIEQTLSIGVHGPKEIHVIILDEAAARIAIEGH
ncbi:MAG: lactate utilization protein [Chloroflexi bacterium]|nr:lactate utilization protein [Chloroflexota bacterium]